MEKRLFRSLLCIVFWGICMESFAVSAYPGIVRYRCPDGSYVNLRLKGDENCKWAVTEDGYTLLRDSVGEWCYAGVDRQGNAVISDWKLSAVRSKGVDDFLRNTPGGLKITRKPSPLKSAVSRLDRMPVPVVGQQKTLVILMQYQDVRLEKSPEDFSALFNQPNYQDDGARGSVKDFYRENSYGLLDLTCDVLGPFTTSQPMDYYGQNGRSDQDEHPTELFLEALEAVSSLVDLADYDTDHDGYINNIHIIFAGYGEEAGGPAEAIWSHEAIFAEPLEVAGVKIGGYSCAPELRGNQGSGISRIGVHCHEMGHSFGALDFYDTDYETNGEYSGTGQWDLMASGSWNNDGITPAHFNPYVKTLFGWTDCEVLEKDLDRVVLPPALESNKIYRINTDLEGDYYLLENRLKVGFDEALPGNGLMIYHILPQITARSVDNTINATFPQTCYPVCAGSEYVVPGKAPFTYGNVNSWLCPFPGGSVSTEFTPWTVPAALSSGGGLADVSLKNISLEEDGSISFRVLDENSSGEQAVVFSEGFENNNLAWLSEQIQGDTQWEIYKPSILTPTLPQVVEGRQCLMMKIEWKYMPLSTSRVVSPIIRIAGKGRAFLSFQYLNQSVLLKHGTLRVLFKPAGQLDWQYLATLPDVNSRWKQYQVDLPVTGADFQIAFEGEMEAGLILVDDVKVYSDVATSTVQIPMPPVALACYGMKGKVAVESDKSARISIYDLAGKIIYSGILNKGMNTIEIEPGLYIGVSENATSKFYVY